MTFCVNFVLCCVRVTHFMNGSCSCQAEVTQHRVVTCLCFPSCSHVSDPKTQIATLLRLGYGCVSQCQIRQNIEISRQTQKKRSNN